MRTASLTSADIARPLTALALVALAFLLMAKPMAQLARRLLGRDAGGIRKAQTQLSVVNRPHEPLRDILDRAAGTARSQEEQRTRRLEWPQQIARAMQDLAEATDAYRNGEPAGIKRRTFM